MIDLWDRVVGQDRAVALLRRAASRPSHAYLLAGPSGSGVEEAARCFAAALVCARGGCAECDRCVRVLRGRHPDVLEVEPAGQQFLVDQAAFVIEEAYRSPFEAERKVIVLHEAERMNDQAANKLLKTFEEPPARTHVVLLTSAPDELAPTVQSRCQLVTFGALPDAAVREALIGEGIDPARAAEVAALAGGRLDRARRLAGDHDPLRRAFAGAATRLDGTGATVAAIVEELLAVTDASFASLAARQEQELAALEEEIETGAYPARTAGRMRKTLEERHRRAVARARIDALAEGITALESVYRDVMAVPAPARNPDLPVVDLDPSSAAAAAAKCASAHRGLLDAPALNRALLLEDLLLGLPPAGGSGANGSTPAGRPGAGRYTAPAAPE